MASECYNFCGFMDVFEDNFTPCLRHLEHEEWNTVQPNGQINFVTCVKTRRSYTFDGKKNACLQECLLMSEYKPPT